MSSRIRRKAIRRQRRKEKRKDAMATEVKAATDAALKAFDEMDKCIKSIRVTPPEGVMLARGFESLARTYDECLRLLNGPRRLSLVKSETDATETARVEPEPNLEAREPLACVCGSLARDHDWTDPMVGTCAATGCAKFIKPEVVT